MKILIFVFAVHFNISYSQTIPLNYMAVYAQQERNVKKSEYYTSLDQEAKAKFDSELEIVNKAIDYYNLGILDSAVFYGKMIPRLDEEAKEKIEWKLKIVEPVDYWDDVVSDEKVIPRPENTFFVNVHYFVLTCSYARMGYDHRFLNYYELSRDMADLETMDLIDSEINNFNIDIDRLIRKRENMLMAFDFTFDLLSNILFPICISDNWAPARNNGTVYGSRNASHK